MSLSLPRWSRVDLFTKVPLPRDLNHPTHSGQCLSLLALLLIVCLLFAEWFSSDTLAQLIVDGNSGQQRVRVHLNVSVIAVTCLALGLDIEDSRARHETAARESTRKTDLADGGCRLEADFHISRVPGNFHVSTHAAAQQPSAVDMRHVVHALRFGDAMGDTWSALVPALTSLRESDQSGADPRASHEYYVKIVPTVLESAGETKHAFQYTYALKSGVAFAHQRSVPAVYFRHDFSPLAVHLKHRSFWALIVNSLAIIGGVYSAAQLADRLLWLWSENRKHRLL